jgi:hypothetical protein
MEMFRGFEKVLVCFWCSHVAIIALLQPARSFLPFAPILLRQLGDAVAIQAEVSGGVTDGGVVTLMERTSGKCGPAP